MKKINNYLKFLLFCLIISAFSISKSFAASNPYKKTGPYGTNCTWYVWKTVKEKAGVSLPGWGDAKKWYNDAKKDGYNVGSAPKGNSIIVWGDWTSYGHVGYVESVEGNILNVWDSTGPCIDEENPEYRECMANSVSEESDKICNANAKRIACKYDISDSVYSITGFIYLDNVPKKEINSSIQNTNKSETKKEEVTIKKSDNNNLNNIEISNLNVDFDKKILKYSFEVEYDVDKITVNGIPEDNKAIVNGNGDYNLNIGLNEIKLIVTAEDKSKKEYVILVTRNEKIEIESGFDNNKEEVKEIVIKNDSYQKFGLMFFVIFIILLILFIIFRLNNKHNKIVKIVGENSK